MILYHYTSPDDGHLGSILRAGRIKATDPNIMPDQADPRNKPPVVWLTDDPNAAADQHGLGPLGKHRVRFTVDVAGIRWMDWQPANEMPPTWRAAIIRAGGGQSAADRWYVFPAAISAKRWLAIHVDGQMYAERIHQGA